MRKRWIYRHGQAIEVSQDYEAPKGPMIFGDLPSYRSPIDGHWIDGRRQRQEDLKRNRARPWEGLEQEKKEAARQQRYLEEKIDRNLEKAAAETYYQLSPSKRDLLKKI